MQQQSQHRILDCPACNNAMRVVERGGVSIDRCTSCKGVFLDNGELEKLLTTLRAPDDEDDDWLKKPAAAGSPPSVRRYDDDDHHEYHRHHTHKHHGKHRKKSALHSFLEVFD